MARGGGVSFPLAQWERWWDEQVGICSRGVGWERGTWFWVPQPTLCPCLSFPAHSEDIPASLLSQLPRQGRGVHQPVPGAAECPHLAPALRRLLCRESEGAAGAGGGGEPAEDVPGAAGEGAQQHQEPCPDPHRQAGGDVYVPAPRAGPGEMSLPPLPSPCPAPAALSLRLQAYPSSSPVAVTVSSLALCHPLPPPLHAALGRGAELM